MFRRGSSGLTTRLVLMRLMWKQYLSRLTLAFSTFHCKIITVNLLKLLQKMALSITNIWWGTLPLYSLLLCSYISNNTNKWKPEYRNNKDVSVWTMKNNSRPRNNSDPGTCGEQYTTAGHITIHWILQFSALVLITNDILLVSSITNLSAVWGGEVEAITYWTYWA